MHGSSSPTRGCSEAAQSGVERVLVLPADAGVFRSEGWVRGRRRGPPRRRGGVPSPHQPADSARWSSPPTRGCSGHAVQRGQAGRVLPADAGVFRQAVGCRRPDPSPPRRRGGVPGTPYCSACERASSPPTRGCSAAAGGALHLAEVLPADAGVFRSPGRSARRCSGPPRRRGGVPPGQVWLVNHPSSSPPTRGCSDRRSSGRPESGVLPADAGVFRRSISGTMVCTCPPRRRGGVPLFWGITTAGATSSPPTRGCSAGGSEIAPQDLVLPADAGVFREARSSVPLRTGPPRRRGGVPLKTPNAGTPAPSSLPTRGVPPPEGWRCTRAWPPRRGRGSPQGGLPGLQVPRFRAYARNHRLNAMRGSIGPHGLPKHPSARINERFQR